MGTLKVTAKGQVTLKKDVLRHLGVAPGQKVDIDMMPDGSVEIRAMRAKDASGNVADLLGLLKRSGQPALTIEEMNDLIADGWAGRR
ncbi:MAG: AbrB/MazE/SpoVT family DNA-binding domain-containing protein [Alphaproteobacteria bacterium]|nr:AbrB/MazE/SpoVT family DNA-binding domain-containing protein [Alphaproteobacteria bacterium]